MFDITNILNKIAKAEPTSDHGTCKCITTGTGLQKKMRECLRLGGSFTLSTDVSKCQPSSFDECSRGSCAFNYSCTADIGGPDSFTYPGRCRERFPDPKPDMVISR